MPIEPSPSIYIDSITDLYQDAGLQSVEVLRLDRVHPVVSGNKWFKLRFFLEEAMQKHRPVLSFGGAWSNHIVATAYACREAGIPCTGIIRGERPSVLSAALQDAREYGMHLHFTDRQSYRHKEIPANLLRENPLIIPEGGYGASGAAGFASLIQSLPSKDYTDILCAVGTGTMMSGTLQAMPQTRVTGISVLKGFDQAEAAIHRLAPEKQIREIIVLKDYHEGGYGRYSARLLQFMNHFFEQSRIPTDFVYTGKLFFAFDQLCRSGYFPPGSRILLIHSGGLQGNRGLPAGLLDFSVPGKDP